MQNSSQPRKCCGVFPLEITGNYSEGYHGKWIKFECPNCERSTQREQINYRDEQNKYHLWNELAAKTLVEKAMKAPGGPERVAKAIEANIPMAVTATAACPSCGSVIKNRKQMFCMVCGQKLKFN